MGAGNTNGRDELALGKASNVKWNKFIYFYYQFEQDLMSAHVYIIYECRRYGLDTV